MITIAIPSYNQQDTIAESLRSALSQSSVTKEILVIDDCSTDNTADIIKSFPSVRLLQNSVNLGIGNNLVKLMREANGEYIVFLCGDDVFCRKDICRRVERIFNCRPRVGVIDRNYYQFVNGKICGLINEPNIYQSSCQPSGMAFRNDRDLIMTLNFCNDIFIEMPLIVRQFLAKWKEYKIKHYTIKARIHKNNTATKSFYYNGQSPTRNWVSLVGKEFRFPEGFIQMKNRAPQYLLREIWITITLTPMAMLDWKFWFCAIVAILTPRIILINLSWWWREHISTRLFKWRRKC